MKEDAVFTFWFSLSQSHIDNFKTVCPLGQDVSITSTQAGHNE